MDEVEKLKNKYNELFPADMAISKISDSINAMKQDAETDFFRREFCNELTYTITAGFIEYRNVEDFKSNELIRIFLDNEKKLPEADSFYHMLGAFYRGKQKECLKYFDVICDKENSAEQYDEALIVDTFLEPMKEAFPGFWEHAYEKLKPLCIKNGSQELCLVMSQLYSRTSDDEAVEILTAFIQKYPDIMVVKEYLACIYFNLKMYQNAIAWFESIGETEESILFATSPWIREALLGDCHGKLRDYQMEEKHYKKSLEYNVNTVFVRNNLGYSLYKQKRYIEALEIFRVCVEEKKDLPYSANNYLRTLIALGRNKDAKAFARKKEFKITKSLVEKANKLPDTNQRITKKDIEAEAKLKEQSVDAVVETVDSQVDTAALKIKGTQFSTEKILEDELTQRIENGMPVFGMNLKMYKRKGEYGRQYIIPVGRLDLFCEDEAGNLYVIELKKDSGYDDAYQQTADYLEWFAGSPRFKNKKIYGIICLNNPSAELISKVQADERMRLFEYQVSYTEIN